MVHLPQDEFLTALTRLFGATRDKGSLYITFKRVPVKGATVAEGEQPPSECLIRARSEKKRISTTVRVRATRVLSATPVRVELARAGRGRGGGGGAVFDGARPPHRPQPRSTSDTNTHSRCVRACHARRRVRRTSCGCIQACRTS